jgi:hypothetical protein
VISSTKEIPAMGKPPDINNVSDDTWTKIVTAAASDDQAETRIQNWVRNANGPELN